MAANKTMHIAYRGLIAAGFAAFASNACVPSPRVPAHSVPPPVARAPSAAPSPPRDPDDVPSFVQRAGTATITRLPPAQARIVGRLTTRQATYLLVRAQHEPTFSHSPLETVTSRSGRLLLGAVVEGDPASQSPAAPEYSLIIRVPLDLPPDELNQITWTTRGNWESDAWSGGCQQTIEVPDTAPAPILPKLEAQFGQALAKWFEVSGRGEPFAAFAAARLRRRFGQEVPSAKPNAGRGPTELNDLAELMSFYTARSAINDSLQLERGLQLPRRTQPRTRTLTSLEVPETAQPTPADDEASAYQQFRSRYTAELRGIVDPVALRIERTAASDDLITELSVFPVLVGGKFNSEFRSIREWVGNSRIDPGPHANGLSLAVGLGDDSPIRRWADSGLANLFGRRDLNVSFVGDWIKVGLDESAAVWDLAGRANLIAQVAAARTADSRWSIDRTVTQLPLWVAVHVRSRLLLTAALAAARAKAQNDVSDLIAWEKDEPYRGVPVTRVSLQDSSASDAVHANVYYAVVKDVLLLTLLRKVMFARIDDVLNGKVPLGSKLSASPTQYALDASLPADGWLSSVTQAALDRAAIYSNEHACLGAQLLTRGLGSLPGDSDQRRAIALRLLGYEPESPDGKLVQWSDGRCAGSGFGGLTEPVVPNAADPATPLHHLVSSVLGLRFSLGLLPFGDAVELNAAVQLKQRHLSDSDKEGN